MMCVEIKFTNDTSDISVIKLTWELCSFLVIKPPFTIDRHRTFFFADINGDLKQELTIATLPRNGKISIRILSLWLF